MGLGLTVLQMGAPGSAEVGAWSFRLSGPVQLARYKPTALFCAVDFRSGILFSPYFLGDCTHFRRPLISLASFLAVI